MKILIAVDGSDISTRAVKFAIKLAGKLAEPPSITLAAVDPPLFPGAGRKLGAEAVRLYHDENFERMLQPGRRLLERAGLAVTERNVIGEIAPTLLELASKGRHQLIVMGSHGRGAVKELVLGSVSSKVLAQTTVPVTIVR
ncbi:universal stress protein [Luteimonas vadosa]|uniref:Universal stress protein n=1 Tax=Luteimonas vadosa TaxID=1165507 RepID=A0ABP9E5X4_9GAMM